MGRFYGMIVGLWVGMLGMGGMGSGVVVVMRGRGWEWGVVEVREWAREYPALLIALTAVVLI